MNLGFIGTGKITSSVVTGICRSDLKYKYNPQIRVGVAIEVPNVRTVVIFKIEDANKPVDYVPEGCD